jgi:proteasome accessory factor A
MECLFGLDTMFNRTLINTRQEHHADPKRFRRLHLILGDANMSDFSTMLKVGTTQIVLQMLEDDFIASDFSLRDELGALRQISTQYDCEIEMADGRKTNAIALQRRFLELARKYCLRQDVSCVPQADLILENWSQVLDGLQNLKLSRDFDLEDDPEDLRGKLDWVLKLWLFTRYRRKKNLDWNHPQLKILDLQYHNIDRDEGIFYSLLDQGIAQSVLDEAEVSAFVEEAPPSTRAWFRSRCLQKFGREVYLVNWEVVGFAHGDIHRMVPLLNPLKGTKSRFEEVFDKAGDSKELLGLLEKKVP